jgi:hypothetical protein
MDKKEFKKWFAKANNFRLIYEEKCFKVNFWDDFFGYVVEEWYPDVFPYLNNVNNCFEKRNFNYIECLFFVLEYFEYIHTTGCFRSAVRTDYDQCIQFAGVSVYLSIIDSLNYLDFRVKKLDDGEVPVILKQEISRVKSLYKKEQPFTSKQLANEKSSPLRGGVATFDSFQV